MAARLARVIRLGSAVSDTSSDAAPITSATPASSTGITVMRGRLRNDRPALASSAPSSTSTGDAAPQSASSTAASAVDGASKLLTASNTASEPRCA